ncbi:DNA-binding LacI/PurR family transcriptional regulator [Streptacidiphilus sp. MAP12-33]|uniref:substrate-binding domain-containing protein n=1 Tax=Streptacidiphilus sp. MAP12-33 TaxID=3156266 RepID=UPI00351562D8
MPATADARHRKILELLRDRPALPVGELATALGVSSATLRRDVEALARAGRLSRAHGRVSRPDGPGRGPGSGPVIGMLVPASTNYYAEVIRGARAVAAQAGARLVLGVSGYSARADPGQLKALLDADAQGLLLTPTWAGAGPDAEEEQRILTLDRPAVLVERRTEPGTALAGLDCVRTDHAHGAALAVRHLAALGRRRIALLADPLSPTSPHLRDGHAATTGALGLTGPVAGSAEEVLREAAAGRVDAALVHSDVDALRLLQLAQARGLKTPDDLAVVAYDDDVAGLADVPLTAVAPPKQALGESAVRLLLERLGAGVGEPGPAGAQQPPRHLELLPRLWVRHSCGGRSR